MASRTAPRRREDRLDNGGRSYGWLRLRPDEDYVAIKTVLPDYLADRKPPFALAIAMRRPLHLEHGEFTLFDIEPP